MSSILVLFPITCMVIGLISLQTCIQIDNGIATHDMLEEELLKTVWSATHVLKNAHTGEPQGVEWGTTVPCTYGALPFSEKGTAAPSTCLQTAPDDILPCWGCTSPPFSVRQPPLLYRAPRYGQRPHHPPLPPHHQNKMTVYCGCGNLGSH